MAFDPKAATTSEMDAWRAAKAQAIEVLEGFLAEARLRPSVAQSSAAIAIKMALHRVTDMAPKASE